MNIKTKMQIRNICAEYISTLPAEQQTTVKDNIRVNSIIEQCSVLDSYVAFANNQCLNGNDELATTLEEANYG